MIELTESKRPDIDDILAIRKDDTYAACSACDALYTITGDVDLADLTASHQFRAGCKGEIKPMKTKDFIKADVATNELLETVQAEWDERFGEA